MLHLHKRPVMGHATEEIEQLEKKLSDSNPLPEGMYYTTLLKQLSPKDQPPTTQRRTRDVGNTE